MVQQSGSINFIACQIVLFVVININAQLLQMGSFPNWISQGGLLLDWQQQQGSLIDQLNHNNFEQENTTHSVDTTTSQDLQQQQQQQYQQTAYTEQHQQELHIVGPTLSQTTISVPGISVESGLLQAPPAPISLMDDVNTYLLTPSPPPPSPDSAVSVFFTNNPPTPVSQYIPSPSPGPAAPHSIFDQLRTDNNP